MAALIAVHAVVGAYKGIVGRSVRCARSGSLGWRAKHEDSRA